MDVASKSDSGDGEWEICNDRGFIYKRRRRRRVLDPVQAEAGTSAAGDSEAEQRRCRRDLRRRCLLHLRDLFRRELELLEPLSSGPVDLTPAMPTEAAPEAPPAVAEPPHPDPGEDIQKSLVDDLLSQVEIQEAVLRKLSESCDYVDSLCNEKEERLLQSLMALPIWGSPRSLVLSLSK
ncbi:uncharacterized protein LOC122020059 [Zingiber officinale]|uniref:Uncharacterized protein n=1 Tax=Zingiber officinale TaxID=94328 RepID=A0A8J5KJS6_ZINOF|nr:uncharacterized protein LOC122020059 [Zingiber officinale]KAG6479533.1 hypothetical protein ZIOFF_062999 [Zingiber officinale]